MSESSENENELGCLASLAFIDGFITAAVIVIFAFIDRAFPGRIDHNVMLWVVVIVGLPMWIWIVVMGLQMIGKFFDCFRP